jgi:hypothetical protein
MIGKDFQDFQPSHILRLQPHSLPFVPRNSLLELDRTASKDIKRTTDSQVHPTTTQLLHQLQVLQMPSTARISDRNSADGRQELDKLSVNTSLLAFDISSMDEEFRAVRFEEGDVFFWRLVRISCCSSSVTADIFNSPLVMAKSVMVCHLSIATRHPPSTRRQLRSMTSLLVSPPSEARTACRRSRAKVPEGKRKDVMMTYPWGERESLSCLNLCLNEMEKNKK